MASDRFAARRAEAMDAFFERLGVPKEERTPERLAWTHVDQQGGACELCGTRIKYRFHLRDSKTEPGGRNDLVVGSDCIETYLEVHPAQQRRFKDDRGRLMREMQNRAWREEKERDARDVRKAIEMIEDLALQTGSDESRVLGMLTEVRDKGWPFSPRRREWARNRVKALRQRIPA